MIYKNATAIVRYVRRSLRLTHIIDRARTVYRDVPDSSPATTMQGLRVTNMYPEASTITFSVVSSAGEPWPLQYSRGWDWHDIAWGDTITLPKAGDSIWIRPKRKFYYSEGCVRISGTGRWVLDGNLALLFNPDGYVFPAGTTSATSETTFQDCTALLGDLVIDRDLSAFNMPGLRQIVFAECPNLQTVTIPDDTATRWIFADCTMLREVIAPKATIMPNVSNAPVTAIWFPSAVTGSCAQHCRSLTSAILPALTAQSPTDLSMCDALTHIRVGFTSWNDNTVSGWVSGVAANGTFVKHASLPTEFGPHRIPTGWTVLVDTPAITATGDDCDAVRYITLSTDLADATIRYTLDGTVPSATHGFIYTAPLTITSATTIRAIAIDAYGESDVVTQTIECLHALTFTAVEAASTVTLTATGTLATTPPALEYSTDGTTWNTLTANTTLTLAAVGDKLHLRAASGSANCFWTSANDRAHFTLTGTLRATGSVMSLIDPTWYQDGYPEITTANALRDLFEDCDALTGRAPELPAFTGAADCYHSMFQGCTGLTGAVVGLITLNATAMCASMFEGCTSLRYLEVHFSDWNDADLTTLAWVDDVADNGWFKCPAALANTHDISHKPVGWSADSTIYLDDAETLDHGFEAE